MIRQKEKKSTTHFERQGKRASWGENGPVRPTTDAYRNGWDAIFGKKDKKVVDKL